MRGLNQQAVQRERFCNRLHTQFPKYKHWYLDEAGAFEVWDDIEEQNAWEKFIASETTAGWKPDDLVGRTLYYSNEDGKGMSTSSYRNNGKVAITIVEKIGDPPIAPLLYWGIDEQGVLVTSIYEDMRNPMKTALVERRSDSVVVRRSGKLLTLKYN